MCLAHSEESGTWVILCNRYTFSGFEVWWQCRSDWSVLHDALCDRFSYTIRNRTAWHLVWRRWHSVPILFVCVKSVTPLLCGTMLVLWFVCHYLFTRTFRSQQNVRANSSQICTKSKGWLPPMPIQWEWDVFIIIITGDDHICGLPSWFTGALPSRAVVLPKPIYASYAVAIINPCNCCLTIKYRRSWPIFPHIRKLHPWSYSGNNLEGSCFFFVSFIILKLNGSAVFPFVFQHEQASIAMFRFLVESNNMRPIFAKFGLYDVDIMFIQELITGQRGVARPPEKAFLYEVSRLQFGSFCRFSFVLSDSGK